MPGDSKEVSRIVVDLYWEASGSRRWQLTATAMWRRTLSAIEKPYGTTYPDERPSGASLLSSSWRIWAGWRYLGNSGERSRISWCSRDESFSAAERAATWRGRHQTGK
jgi:hypothetical protein